MFCFVLLRHIFCYDLFSHYFPLAYRLLIAAAGVVRLVVLKYGPVASIVTQWSAVYLVLPYRLIRWPVSSPHRCGVCAF